MTFGGWGGASVCKRVCRSDSDYIGRSRSVVMLAMTTINASAPIGGVHYSATLIALLSGE